MPVPTPDSHPIKAAKWLSSSQEPFLAKLAGIVRHRQSPVDPIVAGSSLSASLEPEPRCGRKERGRSRYGSTPPLDVLGHSNQQGSGRRTGQVHQLSALKDVTVRAMVIGNDYLAIDFMRLRTQPCCSPVSRFQARISSAVLASCAFCCASTPPSGAIEPFSGGFESPLRHLRVGLGRAQRAVDAAHCGIASSRCDDTCARLQRITTAGAILHE